jgi:cell division protein ZapA (FtsZ GTPase activity inhibitor)
MNKIKNKKVPKKLENIKGIAEDFYSRVLEEAPGLNEQEAFINSMKKEWEKKTCGRKLNSESINGMRRELLKLIDTRYEEVILLGQKLRIRADTESRDHILEVAEYIDKEIQKLQDSGRGVSSSLEVALLATMNIADKYLELVKKH